MRALFLLSVIALTMSSTLPRQGVGEALAIPSPRQELVRPRPLSLYESAVVGTPVPAQILEAIAKVESGERDDAVGPDGHDIGRMQIRELFREERVRKYGEYDPRDPKDAVRIATAILCEHYARFGCWTLAVSAYNTGAGGTARNGPRMEYVSCVEAVLGHGLDEFNGGRP